MEKNTEQVILAAWVMLLSAGVRSLYPAHASLKRL